MVSPVLIFGVEISSNENWGGGVEDGFVVLRGYVGVGFLVDGAYFDGVVSGVDLDECGFEGKVLGD